jgi:hypothetical protein
MRPDPQDLRSDGDDGRIIYLGDVRRRRTSRGRQQPVGHYLAALGLIALASWAVWLTVVFTLEPARLLTYVAFLLPLACALTTTAGIVLYLTELRIGRVPSLGAELRRGLLFALIIVMNLAFMAGHRWSVLVFGLSVLLALAVEGLANRRNF